MLKPVEKQRVVEEIVDSCAALSEWPVPTGFEAPGARAVETVGVNRIAGEARRSEPLAWSGSARATARVQNSWRPAGSSWSSTCCCSPAAPSDPIPEFPAVRQRARAARAARARTDALNKLRALADRADQVTGSLDLFDLDFDFYVAVAQLSGNQVMLLLINTVRDGVRNYMPLLANLAAPQDIVRKHHRELIAALERGDSAAAGRIADEYLRMGAELAARVGNRPEAQAPPE
jgi:hypothetical protein